MLDYDDSRPSNLADLFRRIDHTLDETFRILGFDGETGRFAFESKLAIVGPGMISR